LHGLKQAFLHGYIAVEPMVVGKGVDVSWWIKLPKGKICTSVVKDHMLEVLFVSCGD
jgi:hypothetical protein